MVDCSCLIDDDSGDKPEVFHERMVKARKEYRCVECGEAIQKGERHECATGVWAGEWATYRTCDTCRVIRGDYCCSWVYGDLREALWGVLGVDYVTGVTADDD